MLGVDKSKLYLLYVMMAFYSKYDHDELDINS